MALEALALDFVSKLTGFSYTLSVVDKVWHILFPDQRGQWQHLHINQYQHSYFLTHLNGRGNGLTVEPGKGVHVQAGFGASFAHADTDWELLLESAHSWLKVVRKDWIKANQRVQAEYPLTDRWGTVPHALLRASLPDIYRLDVALGEKAGQFVDLVESGHFLKTKRDSQAAMTANDYFAYCKLAYLAAQQEGEVVDESLSGRDLYTQFADGRHEGLLDIEADSPSAFADWLDGSHPARVQGGHPWEIKRGGNTTHIDLSVSRPTWQTKEGFKVALRGEAIHRLAETVQMFLAIQTAQLPITIANPEAIRQRILAQDNWGVVPGYTSLHRAYQHFPQAAGVYDVIHYADLGRFKRRITPFITWEPLPLLMPAALMPAAL